MWARGNGMDMGGMQMWRASSSSSWIPGVVAEAIAPIHETQLVRTTEAQVAAQ